MGDDDNVVDVNAMELFSTGGYSTLFLSCKIGCYRSKEINALVFTQCRLNLFLRPVHASHLLLLQEWSKLMPLHIEWNKHT